MIIDIQKIDRNKLKKMCFLINKDIIPDSNGIYNYDPIKKTNSEYSNRSSLELSDFIEDFKLGHIISLRISGVHDYTYNRINNRNFKKVESLKNLPNTTDSFELSNYTLDYIDFLPESKKYAFQKISLNFKDFKFDSTNKVNYHFYKCTDLNFDNMHKHTNRLFIEHTNYKGKLPSVDETLCIDKSDCTEIILNDEINTVELRNLSKLKNCIINKNIQRLLISKCNHIKVDFKNIKKNSLVTIQNCKKIDVFDVLESECDFDLVTTYYDPKHYLYDIFYKNNVKQIKHGATLFEKEKFIIDSKVDDISQFKNINRYYTFKLKESKEYYLKILKTLEKVDKFNL